MQQVSTQDSEPKNRRAIFLDRVIPLGGASHADVVEYSVDVPTRYAQCFARLADGRVLRLQDPSQFIGWSGRDGKRSFLFRRGRRRIELQTDAGLRLRNARSGYVGVINWFFLPIKASEVPVHNHATRQFIARDGSQLVIRHWAQIFGRRVGRLAPMRREERCQVHGLVSAA